MILVSRDCDGYLQGAIDFFLVDSHGFPSATGQSVFVSQLELNPGRASLPIIRGFIREIARLCPTATIGYWERREKARAGLRAYHRRSLRPHREEALV